MMIEMEKLHKIFEEKITNQINLNIKNLEEKTKNYIENQVSLIKDNLVFSSRKKKENENKSTIKTNSGRISDLDTLKEIRDDLNNHEENFEKVQENFIKINSNINQLEENQKIFNEIIITLKDNYDKINKKFDDQVKVLDIWQKNIFNSLKNSMNNGVDDYNKKNNKNSANIKNEENKENFTRNLQNSDENIIKTIEDVNKDKEEENENVLTDNAYYFEDKDNDLREHTHGYINNVIQDFALINDNLEPEKIILNNNEKSIIIKSRNNNIKKENKEQNDEKSQKNEVYVRTSVTELIEYKDNEIFYNYLKKYMHPMENIENEIEFNINESQNNKKNGDISNSQNENIQSDNGYEVEDNYDDIEELNI